MSNKYYIGKSCRPSVRINTHFRAHGALWTKMYKPLEVVEVIPNCDNYDEDKYTIRYMEKYGIENVRGGSFCQINLSDSNLITLRQIIHSVSDRCFICGGIGHFAKNCKK